MKSTRKLPYYILIISGVSFAVMALYVMPKAGAALAAASIDPTCAKPFDLQFGGITWQSINESFTCMGEEGMQVYRTLSSLHDVFYPITYGPFFSLCLFFLVRISDVTLKGVALRSWARRFALLPILAIWADFAENYTIVSLIDHHPTLQSGYAMQLSIFNTLKWLFIAFSVVLIVVFAVLALRRKYSSGA